MVLSQGAPARRRAPCSRTLGLVGWPMLGAASARRWLETGAEEIAHLRLPCHWKELVIDQSGIWADTTKSAMQGLPTERPSMLRSRASEEGCCRSDDHKQARQSYGFLISVVSQCCQKPSGHDHSGPESVHQFRKTRQAGLYRPSARPSDNSPSRKQGTRLVQSATQVREPLQAHVSFSEAGVPSKIEAREHHHAQRCASNSAGERYPRFECKRRRL